MEVVNLLRQPLALLGGAATLLFIIAFAIPVPRYCIELQADGTSLGCFSSQGIRLVGTALGMVPLAVAAAMISALDSRRMKANAPIYVGIASAVGLLMLACILHTFRN
jgi:hypothetical protein